jgi:hypothetical protein
VPGISMGATVLRMGRDMRLIVCVCAMLIAGSVARAQGWQEHTYPAYSFGVSFPTEPKVETTTYPAPDGRTAPAHVFSVTENDAVFKMTVVELPGMEENAVLDHAIKTLAQGAEIKLDIPARVARVYGRQLSIISADGTRSSDAIFYHLGRLYQIEGKAISGNEAPSYAIRFQQSLIFTGGETNRPDIAREARGNCRNAAGANASGAAAAGGEQTAQADERCRRRGEAASRDQRNRGNNP